MPLELDWGPDDNVFAVSNGDFQENSRRLFGYPADHEKMKGLADLFLNARTLYAYRINGGGKKAENSLAVARYTGIRGNDLKIVIQQNVDDGDAWDVKTYLGTHLVDSQTVRDVSGLMANDYVAFKPDAVLVATASSPLAGGANGTVDGGAHQRYLDRIESCSFNTMGVTVTEEAVKKLYVAFNRRLRDEMGIKFQMVLYRTDADYMGVISVKNRTLEEDWPESSLVYWVTGAECGCEVNRSVQNRKYNGSFTVDTDYTQIQLRQCISSGELVFHRVGSDIRVLSDINSMVTVSDDCGAIFKDNQTVRVIDQVGNDIAVIFSTRYLGVIPNNNAGRVSLWSDIVSHHRQMARIGAIENFSDADVQVEPGDTKKSVVVADRITVVNAMDRLYMTVTVA